MKKLVLATGLVIGLMFTGCTGVISGHTYTKADVEKARVVAKKAKEAYEEVKKLARTQSTTTDSK